MSTQTVYFNNPATITALQTSDASQQSTIVSMSGAVVSLQKFANPVRGQIVSVTLVQTITANSYTGTNALLSFQYGPLQNVKVYKVLYYSGLPLEQNAILCSASLLVPDSITKSQIYTMMRPTLSTVSDEFMPWRYAQDFYPVLTPVTRVSGNAGFTWPIFTISIASRGYVVIAADGFGQNSAVGGQPYFGYFEESNPHIDLIRCIRTLATSTNGDDKAIVNNYSFATPTPFVLDGYSLGTCYNASVALEFQPGISDTIPSTEAANVLITRIMGGSVVSPAEYFKVMDQFSIYQYNSNWINVLAPSNNLATFAALIPTAKPRYRALFQGLLGDYKTNGPTTTGNFNQQLLYEYTTDPAYPNQGYSGPAWNYALTKSTFDAAGVNVCATGADIRQLFYITGPDSIFVVGPYEYGQRHGWSNTSRPLEKLQNIPTVMIYSNYDELTQLNGVDTNERLDKYWSTGVINAPFYFFTGAQKTVTVQTPTFGVPSIPSSIATTVGYMTSATGASYTRIKMNTVGLISSGGQTHAGFGPVYYELTYQASPNY